MSRCGALRRGLSTDAGRCVPATLTRNDLGAPAGPRGGFPARKSPWLPEKASYAGDTAACQEEASDAENPETTARSSGAEMEQHACTRTHTHVRAHTHMCTHTHRDGEHALADG